jgi:hypothetical protein
VFHPNGIARGWATVLGTPPALAIVVAGLGLEASILAVLLEALREEQYWLSPPAAAHSHSQVRRVHGKTHCETK